MVAPRKKSPTRSSKPVRGKKAKKNDPPKARKAGTGRLTTAESKKQADSKRQRQQKVRQMKERVRQTVYGLYAISLVAALLMTLSVAFLVFNWKNVTIDRYTMEISQLRDELYRLNAEIKRREGDMVKIWLREERIVSYAEKNLGLKRSIDQPRSLRVDKSRLELYARKDAETEREAAKP
ncbi:MAG TPA: hypothetical protein PKV71_06970 [Calditrichia bacterium]|nr:hypothetical protein [Calditrichota bacterium]HQU70906.1 hypothetical protein [Calditrichia bacterium]HQV31598.1 hypothetical protein [Calditrichia bacterium]